MRICERAALGELAEVPFPGRFPIQVRRKDARGYLPDASMTDRGIPLPSGAPRAPQQLLPSDDTNDDPQLAHNLKEEDGGQDEPYECRKKGGGADED